MDDNVILFEEGAKSYLDALTALGVFQQQTRAICQQCVERRTEDLSATLGLNLSDYAIKPWMTSAEEVNGTLAVLGVSQVNFSPSCLACWCGLYCGLCWDHSKDSLWFGACVAMGIGNGRKCKELFEQLNAPGVSKPFVLTLNKQWKTIWLSLPLSTADMAVVDQKLDQVLSAWLQLWQHRTGRSTGATNEGAGVLRPIPLEEGPSGTF